jgi:hypothetical protein
MASFDQRNQKSLENLQNPLEMLKGALTEDVRLPSIVEFAEHPSFLGADRLFPRQKTLLRLMCLETENMTDYDIRVINEWAEMFNPSDEVVMGINPDIWKRIEWLKANGYDHFKEIIAIIGRRGGKNHLGAILLAYQLWKLILLDDPQQYYGVARGKSIFVTCIATAEKQAKELQFADLINLISSSKCFAPYIADLKDYSFALTTPADKRRIASFKARGIENHVLVASIRGKVASSNAPGLRGTTCFSVVYDEFAHMVDGTDGPRTSHAIYQALNPALQQFGSDALIFIPTSPYNETGKAYELYKNSIKIDKAGNPEFPTMLTIQLPSWGPYEDWNDVEACEGLPFNARHVPQLYDNAMKALEQRDPETFKVENLSQWAKVTDAFLNPRIVERIFHPFKDNTGIERILTPQDQGKLGYIYYGHADPSKNNNNFAVMVAHAEDIYDPENNETWTHVIVDYINCYKPEDFPEHQIDYAMIEDDLLDVLDRFRSIRKFTFDQYGSFVTVDSLKKRIRAMRPAHRAMIIEEKASLQSNQLQAERFKSAIGMNWVHSFKDQFGPEESCLLEQELKFLQLKQGKVQKMTYGPIRTSDLSDCIFSCVNNLLEDNFHKLELRDRLGKTTLGVAAMGGYHSHTPNELANVGQVSGRQKLKSFSSSWRSYNNQSHDPARGRRGYGRGF